MSDSKARLERVKAYNDMRVRSEAAGLSLITGKDFDWLIARAELAERATVVMKSVLRDGALGAHAYHWDKEGTHGANCPACADNHKVGDLIRRWLEDERK